MGCCLWMAVLVAPTQGASVVVVDAGHGGQDRGTAWNRLIEKSLTLDVAKRLETVLKRNGVTTVMTRRTDKTVSLNTRAAIANKYRNALLVSVHFNASRITGISGFETYYASERGRKVAYNIQRAMVAKVPGKSRGIKKYNYAVLMRTKGAAVLVECGFVSNKAEAARCGSAAHRQLIAEAIARGILRSR